MPVEMLEEVLRHSRKADLYRFLLTSQQVFIICIRLLYRKMGWRTYIEMLTQYPRFGQGPRAHLYASAVRVFYLGGPSNYPNATEWNWTEVIQAISHFSHLQSLAIDRIRFPVYLLPAVIDKFPNLRRLHYRSPISGPSTFTPCLIPSSVAHAPPGHYSALTSLDIRRYAVRDRFGFMDAGVASLASLSALPGLKVLHTDMCSWDTVLRGRERAGWTLPKSLHELVIFSRYPDEDLPMDSSSATSLFRALEACSQSLQTLRILLPYPVQPDSSCRNVDFLQLEEYVGPEGLLPYIKFSPNLRVVWVPRTECVVGPTVDSIKLAAPLGCLHLLSIGSWDANQHPLSSFLTSLTNLQELFLAPLSNVGKVVSVSSILLSHVADGPGTGFNS
ncbi:hypothetical protein PQX77_015497 [Marasmius sp. AFHP31]|nr:hypothetical protein PQX77_015497 [Marasmius sp. AFHP31]